MSAPDLSAVEVITELDAMPRSTDIEVAHGRADRLVIDWMLAHDPASHDVAQAWVNARDRVGFWYA